MKKHHKTRYWLLSFIILLFGGIVFSFIFDFYRITPSQQRVIDGKDGEQYYIENDGADRFIPNKTVTELHSFINAVAGTTGSDIDGKMSNAGSLSADIALCRIMDGTYGEWNTSDCACSGANVIGNKTQNCNISGSGIDYANCVIGCSAGANNTQACTDSDISCGGSNTCSISVERYVISNPGVLGDTDPTGGYEVCLQATTPNETALFAGNNPDGGTFNFGINWPGADNPYCFQSHEYHGQVRNGGSAHYELTVNPNSDNTQCSKDWKSWAVGDWGNWLSITNCEFQRVRTVSCPTGGCDNALKPAVFQSKTFATPQSSPPFVGNGSECQ